MKHARIVCTLCGQGTGGPSTTFVCCGTPWCAMCYELHREEVTLRERRAQACHGCGESAKNAIVHCCEQRWCEICYELHRAVEWHTDDLVEVVDAPTVDEPAAVVRWTPGWFIVLVTLIAALASSGVIGYIIGRY